MSPILMLVLGLGGLMFAATRAAAATPARAPTTQLASQFNWTSVPNSQLQMGMVYRWSVQRRSARTADQIKQALANIWEGLSVWIDTAPPDWAPDDLQPGRNRLEGILLTALPYFQGPDGQIDPTVKVWLGMPKTSQLPVA